MIGTELGDFHQHGDARCAEAFEVGHAAGIVVVGRFEDAGLDELVPHIAAALFGFHQIDNDFAAVAVGLGRGLLSGADLLAIGGVGLGHRLLGAT